MSALRSTLKSESCNGFSNDCFAKTIVANVLLKIYRQIQMQILLGLCAVNCSRGCFKAPYTFCSYGFARMVKTTLDGAVLSVVIPVHNGGESFRRCLDSLGKAMLDSSMPCWSDPKFDPKERTKQGVEIIVVADGETDGSWKVAQQFGTKVIRLPESKGPAKARNVGAESATSDVIFFVDADVEVHPTTLSQVIRAFREDADLAALIGSYDDSPGSANFLSQYKNLFHHYTHQGGCEEASTFWGACGAIRRDIFWEVGGFDQSYRKPCVEDIELGYRLRQANYKIKLCKAIQVKHLKRWPPLSLLRAEVFYRALPWMALLLKTRQAHPEDYKRFSNDLNLRWSSRVSVLLVYSLCLFLIAAVKWPIFLWGAGFFSLVLFRINFSLYRFFYLKRGFLFALRVLPWHWFYYFYSGLAFAAGIFRHQVQRFSSLKPVAN